MRASISRDICILLFVFTPLCACGSHSLPPNEGTEIMTQPAETYTNLRSMILSTNPKDIGIEQSEASPNVWGVLMEFQISDTVVTLVSLADGTTSMYFDSGGGIIGAGQHDVVARASKNFVALAESYYNQVEPTTQFPLPLPGRVRFYLLTFSGICTVERELDQLVRQKDSFSLLFYAGNEVITQIRLHTPSGE
ncbi:MAG: hypothetical protein N2117_00710 [Anaerolineales bacterium]|nr:hypothetical protein [Anaerolineales bacterium]